MRFLYQALCVAFFSILSTSLAQAQTVTETYKVNGECDMCKKNIEMACFALRGMKKASWNGDSLTLTVTFDPKKANKETILRRVAMAGYDNEAFQTAEVTYGKLPDCCQYDRKRITPLLPIKQ